jgi:hypothetical protein
VAFGVGAGIARPLPEAIGDFDFGNNKEDRKEGDTQ